MAQNDSQTSSGQGSAFVKRELNGATFLTLEHTAHMILVVVVSALVAAGILTAVSMWTGGSSLVTNMSSGGYMMMLLGGSLKVVEDMMAIGIVAGLIVLVPLLFLFDRRTRAEWQKRDGYANRVAYKAPVYVALGVLVAVKVVAVIAMLTVVLNSLALIGVSGQSIGTMYLQQFVPALVVALVFAGAAWYVFKLAKGRDYGRTFSLSAALVGMAVAVALFITATISLHNSNSFSPGNYYNTGGSQSQNFENLFNY